MKCKVCNEEIKRDENTILRWNYKTDKDLSNDPETLQIVHQGECDYRTNYNYPCSIVIDDLCHCIYALRYVTSMVKDSYSENANEIIEALSKIAFGYMLDDNIGDSENIRTLLNL